MSVIDWLVENGITTEKAWLQKDKQSFLSYSARQTTQRQIKNALENAAKIMMLTKRAIDYIMADRPPIDITTNRIYRLMEMNGYDPVIAGSIFIGWLEKRFGKRNTIWLHGPATTGKTNIAEAIAHSVPFYGCVNVNNDNFPFNDCTDKMLIWWEEGRMTSKIVESAKAILGGSEIRIDQKCRSSQAVESTPVIITSNTDITVILDGNTIIGDHRDAIRDRVFCFELKRRLDDDFGKITKQEVKDFFKWAEINRIEIKPAFSVSDVQDYKRKRPLVSTPDGGETTKETDASEDSPTLKRVRYENTLEVIPEEED